MQKLICLLVLLATMLTGCGGLEWFPDPISEVTSFSFSPATVADVTAGSTQTSGSVTLAITGVPAAISVSGDPTSEYSIDDGATFTKSPGTVSNGAKVKVRHTASNLVGGVVTTTLTVGDKTATFSTTTGGTVTVAAFTFDPAFNVNPSEVVASNSITVSITGATSADIAVTGDSTSKYSINGGTPTNAIGRVNNGDTVVVQHTAAAGGTETTASTTLTIGDKSATFYSTTGNVVNQTVTATAITDVEAEVRVALRLLQGNYMVGVVDSNNSSYSFDGTNYDVAVVSHDFSDGDFFYVHGFANPPVGTVMTYVFTLDGEPAVTLKVTTIQ